MHEALMKLMGLCRLCCLAQKRNEASAASRVRSRSIFAAQLAAASSSTHAEPHADWAYPKGTCLETRIFCYRGDATNQEAIDKQKIHLSEVCGVHVPLETLHTAAKEDVAFEQDAFEATYHRAVCDIRPVVYGTGPELYNIILKELHSVGCPDWLSEAFDPRNSITIFACVMDQGPDNQAVVKIIRSQLVTRIHVGLVVVWCFMHQYHIAVKNLLLVLDAWSWSNTQISPVYFAGLATISNCWRTAYLKHICQQHLVAASR